MERTPQDEIECAHCRLVYNWIKNPMAVVLGVRTTAIDCCSLACLFLFMIDEWNKSPYVMGRIDMNWFPVTRALHDELIRVAKIEGIDLSHK